MVHAKAKWLTLSQLKELIAQRSRELTGELLPA
jgi:hypothetical protein